MPLMYFRHGKNKLESISHFLVSSNTEIKKEIDHAVKCTLHYSLLNIYCYHTTTNK